MTYLGKDPIIITSWDDGDPYTSKLLELLDKYSLKGTFFIPIMYKKCGVDEKTINYISRNHEIGSHTMTHRKLQTLDNSEIKWELEHSKKTLEKIIDKPVETFSYPWGLCNNKIVNYVRECGYQYARTVEKFQIVPSSDNYKIGTTIQARNIKISDYICRDSLNILKNIPHIFLKPSKFMNWVELAKLYFEKSIEHKGIFHLWGHAWEIEELKIWAELENLFLYISNKKDVKYCTINEAYSITNNY